ncbi:MAG: hypothetical protein RMH77_04925 [Sulfolobales archaeon]|nr:hypothetical protein [Sulfolobales archaeon]MCX8186701.1 hypothetical protein [Sulfolobales archaeon]MDW7969727.1 hypothetical protein [Sulfolobales archaeon]
MSLTNDKAVKLAMEWLSIESNSHAELMKRIYESLNIDVGSPKCDKLVGEPWKTVENIMKDVDRGKIDLMQALTKLEFVEGFVGEEMYNRLMYPILKKLLPELINKDASELVEKLFSEVISEEEHHNGIVKSLIRYEENKRKSPI